MGQMMTFCWGWQWKGDSREPILPLVHPPPVLFTHTIHLWPTALSAHHMLTLSPRQPGSQAGSGSPFWQGEEEGALVM